MTFAEAQADGGVNEAPNVNDKGLIEIGDAQTKGWKVDMYAPAGWIDESYGTLAFARDPQTNASVSLCMEETDAHNFAEYWLERANELKTIYPESEFPYVTDSTENNKLDFEEAEDGSYARLDYVLVSGASRYDCVKIAVIGKYKLYVLTFMFPEGGIEKAAREKIVNDVFTSFEIR